MPRDALVVMGCGWIARRHATAARRIGLPVIFATQDESRARVREGIRRRRGVRVARGFRRSTGWRAATGVAGGGALIDGGIHDVHNLRWWGGEVRRVFALSPPSTHAGLPGEDSIAFLAVLENGVLGFLATSLAAPGIPAVRWSTVTGTRASAFVDHRGRFVAARGTGRMRVRFFPPRSREDTRRC